MVRFVSLLQERMTNPPHHGPLEQATGVGAVGNPACGDVVTMYLAAPEGRVEDASFDSMGSAFQLATASVLCDCILGQTLDELRARTPTCIMERLPDLPENKRYLARLAIDALMRAVDDHERRALGGDAAAPVPASTQEATKFVLDLLANGRQWGTAELAAMAQAEGLVWPTSLAKFLATLRGQGVIAGEMAGTSWRWWSPEMADRGG